jgi:hypothetical protein
MMEEGGLPRAEAERLAWAALHTQRAATGWMPLWVVGRPSAARIRTGNHVWGWDRAFTRNLPACYRKSARTSGFSF